MPRDAFGRDQHEDPLADMGWKRPATPPVDLSGADVPPVGSSTPPAFERPASTPDRPGPPEFVRQRGRSPAPASLAPLLTQMRDAAAAARPRRRRRGPVLSFVVLLLIAAAGLVQFSVGRTVDSGIEGAIDGFARVETGHAPAAPEAGAQPGGSLLRAAGVERAVGFARADGRLESLRVAAGRIDAEVVNAQRRTVILLVYRNGEVRRVGAGTVPRSAIDPIPWSAVDAAAPMRIARAAARDAGRSIANVNYLVMIKFGGTPQWELYFKDGLHYTANARGRAVRRVS
jgi:hypothetical protein